jgi:hypothetical protein
MALLQCIQSMFAQQLATFRQFTAQEDSMHQLPLDVYMAMPWVPLLEPCQDGGFRLTVVGLRDFEIFSDDEEQLKSEWQVALRSFLTGYLRVGKVVPVPVPSISIRDEPQAYTSGGDTGNFAFLLNEPSQVRVFSQPKREPQAA